MKKTGYVVAVMLSGFIATAAWGAPQAYVDKVIEGGDMSAVEALLEEKYTLKSKCEGMEVKYDYCYGVEADIVKLEDALKK